MEPVEQVEVTDGGGASRRRRMALWGVLAAVAVGAGALVVTSADDGDRTASAPRLPIALGGAGGGRAESAMAADLAFGGVTYVPADDLPDLGGQGAAYRVQAPEEADVAAVASALGIEVAPTRTEMGWEASDDAGMLGVDRAGYWWFSSGAAIGGGVPAIESCLPQPEGASEDETSCSDVACPEPEQAAEKCESSTGGGRPVEGDPLPADEAEAVARALFDAVPSGFEFGDVHADGSGDGPVRWVQVDVRLHGQPVEGVGWSASIGPAGEILDASGSLGSPEEVGTYDLLDARAALDRLNEQLAGPVGIEPVPLPAEDVPATTFPAGSAGSAGSCKVQPDGSEICEQVGVDVVCPDVAGTEPACPQGQTDPTPCDMQTGSTCIPPDTAPPCAAPTTTVVADPDSGVSSDQGSASAAAACPPAVDEPPVTTVPPEPAEVVVTGAEHVLLAQPSFDGGELYLVPAYRFDAEDAGRPVVVAVVDEALATDDPASAAPGPTEPSDDCTAPVDEAGGTTITGVPSCGEGWSGFPGGAPTVEPQPLQPGEQPAIGVAYYVDVHVTEQCGWISVELGGRWFWSQLTSEELRGWSQPTEGGTLTMLDADHGEFVGDADGVKVARLEVTADGTEPVCG